MPLLRKLLQTEMKLLLTTVGVFVEVFALSRPFAVHVLQLRLSPSWHTNAGAAVPEMEDIYTSLLKAAQCLVTG